MEMFAGSAAAVVVYFHLSQAKPHTVASMTLMALIGLGVFIWYHTPTVKPPEPKAMTLIRADVAAHTVELPSDIVYVDRMQKKLTYFPQNAEMVKIVTSMIFCRLFDRHRFAEMVNVMDRMQKVYMYILAGRYPQQTHLPILVDLRDGALEIMYSWIFVVRSLKHVYGLDPYQRLDTSIHAFTVLSRKMITVIETYSRSDSHRMETDPMPNAESYMRESKLP